MHDGALTCGIWLIAVHVDLHVGLQMLFAQHLLNILLISLKLAKSIDLFGNTTASKHERLC